MISLLRLLNFQAHKDSRLELSPGVNAIVGPSDKGKTSIIRALRWVVTNRPAGDSFRRWGSDETEVIVTLPDAQVHRIRNKTENLYALNSTAEDGGEFRAFGADVPEPITKALNISPASTQSQHAAHYMLAASPAECARMLNEVADLDDIDKATSAINSMGRAAAEKKRTVEAEVAAFREQLKRYEGLDDRLALLEECVALDTKIEKLAQEEETLGTTLESITTTRRRLEQLQWVEDAALLIDEIEKLSDKIDGTKNKIGELEQCARNVEGAQSALKRARQEKESARRARPEVCPTCQRPL